MLESTAGRLLVATPLLTDPNFERTVIFVCFHDANGAFGLVLNRPVGAPAADLLPEWEESITAPGELQYGGPVERSSFLGLGYIPGPHEDGLEWWTPIARGVGLVNLAADVEEAADSLEALRIYHGYAGWGGGQLDAEIGEDSWFVVDVDPGDPFTERPERLWNDVLARQRGALSIYGTYPLDHRVN